VITGGIQSGNKQVFGRKVNHSPRVVPQLRAMANES